MKNDNFLLRLTDDNDCDKLIKVNSDQNALPFSNSEYKTEGVLISVFLLLCICPNCSVVAELLLKCRFMQRKGKDSTKLRLKKSEKYLYDSRNGYAYNGYWEKFGIVMCCLLQFYPYGSIIKMLS